MKSFSHVKSRTTPIIKNSAYLPHTQQLNEPLGTKNQHPHQNESLSIIVTTDSKAN